jgi:hypothetical protein
MRRSALWSALTALIVIVAALPALAGGTGNQMKKDSKMMGDSVSVTGEVIGSACYIKMGAKGASHAQCATACAKAGIPLAILQDGTNQVIWVASNKDAHSANEDLLPYVAKKVTVTGHYAERGGAKLLVMDSVQPAS